jgi:hypothetical protein
VKFRNGSVIASSFVFSADFISSRKMIIWISGGNDTGADWTPRNESTLKFRILALFLFGLVDFVFFCLIITFLNYAVVLGSCRVHVPFDEIPLQTEERGSRRP